MKAIRTIKESNIKPDEAEIYRALLRHLRRRQGFGLLFVRCSPAQGQRVIEQIEEDLPQKKIATLFLDREIDNLYQLIEEKSTLEQIDILFIAGIEKSFVNYIKPGIGGQGDYYKLDTVPPLLGHLNLQRERFRDNFNFCLVFLVPLFGLKYLVRRSPDFYDWRSGVFEFPADEEKLALEYSRVIEEGDYQKYLSLTPQERYEKILNIRELIEQSDRDLEVKAHLWKEIGRLCVAGKEHEEAIASYDRALQIQPDDSYDWKYRGIALGNLGRYEEAIASCDRALQIQPNDSVAWITRGLALGDLGRHEEALASYDRALQIQPNDSYAWKYRGRPLINLGRYEEAIASYDRALQIQPDDSYDWKYRGWALEKLGRYEESLASYDRALQIQPDDFYAWIYRGWVLGNLGRHEEAIASYDKALQIQPNDSDAWKYRGRALGDLGRYEEVIASYDKALQIQPDDSYAWKYRGWALGNLGRYEESLASYDQALQLQPDYYQAWNNRGIVLGDLGRYEEALASYDKALQLKADYPNPYYNIACCYALQSNVELALENLQQAINLNEKYREMAKTDSDFDNIRSDPRFQSLFEGM